MEGLSVILLCAVFFVLSLAAAFAIAWLNAFVEQKRHDLRVHVRERYVIKNPVRFRIWVNNLSWREVRICMKVLDGKHIFGHLEGILQER